MTTNPAMTIPAMMPPLSGSGEVVVVGFVLGVGVVGTKMGSARRRGERK